MDDTPYTSAGVMRICSLFLNEDNADRSECVMLLLLLMILLASSQRFTALTKLSRNILRPCGGGGRGVHSLACIVWDFLRTHLGRILRPLQIFQPGSRMLPCLGIIQCPSVEMNRAKRKTFIQYTLNCSGCVSACV